MIPLFAAQEPGRSCRGKLLAEKQSGLQGPGVVLTFDGEIVSLSTVVIKGDRLGGTVPHYPTLNCSFVELVEDVRRQFEIASPLIEAQHAICRARGRRCGQGWTGRELKIHSGPVRPDLHCEGPAAVKPNPIGPALRADEILAGRNTAEVVCAVSVRERNASQVVGGWHRWWRARFGVRSSEFGFEQLHLHRRQRPAVRVGNFAQNASRRYQDQIDFTLLRRAES